MDIAGRMVLLTGSTGGIGRAIAGRLAGAGARLLLVARDGARLAEQARELPPGAVTVVADIVSQEGRRTVRDAAAANGVDVVIHNAGTQEFGLFHEQDPTDLQRLFDLNLCAPILLSRELLPLLQQRPEAALVFVGSALGGIGHPGFAAYCASKSGLQRFAESLRRELADSRVRVDYLAPRVTRTALNGPRVVALNEALGNAVDEPEQVAEELLALLMRAHGGERFIGWPEKLFVRINGVLPRIVDRALVAKLATIRRFARCTETEGRTDP